MAKVVLHNISDRPNTPGDPVSIMVGGQKLRPGKRMVVDDSVLNARHNTLHGTRIWIGEELPARFARTSRSALAVAQRDSAQAVPAPRSLTLDEVRERLQLCTAEELVTMAGACTPPVEFTSTPSKAALVARLSRALFQPERELDPEVFFWLGRWYRSGGDYVPKE